MVDIRQQLARPKPFVGTSTGIATRYWPSALIQITSATGAVTAGRLYTQPFNLPGLVIDRLVVETTAGANNAKIGLYSNDNGAPGTLLVDGGIIDVSGIGAVEATIAAFTMPEWCWVGIIFEGTPTVRTGVANQAALGSNSTGSSARGLIATHSYASGLPTTPGAQSFISTCPALFVRKS